MGLDDAWPCTLPVSSTKGLADKSPKSIRLGKPLVELCDAPELLLGAAIDTKSGTVVTGPVAEGAGFPSYKDMRSMLAVWGGTGKAEDVVTGSSRPSSCLKGSFPGAVVMTLGTLSSLISKRSTGAGILGAAICFEIPASDAFSFDPPEDGRGGKTFSAGWTTVPGLLDTLAPPLPENLPLAVGPPKSDAANFCFSVEISGCGFFLSIWRSSATDPDSIEEAATASLWPPPT
jgi:hypothetical protein